jgi:arginine exporter protein ArgO
MEKKLNIKVYLNMVKHIHTLFKQQKINVKTYFNISVQSTNVTWFPVYHNTCRSRGTSNMYQEMRAENTVHIQCGVWNNCGGGMK